MKNVLSLILILVLSACSGKGSGGGAGSVIPSIPPVDQPGDDDQPPTCDEPTPDEELPTDDDDDHSGGGQNPGEDVYAVCHIPKGNPDNAHTIYLAESALQAHLDKGDYLGECQ